MAPNCKFVVDDVESPWMYNPDEAFDFIHGRQMAGSIRDWPALYREIYKNLKPGGYVELQEVDLFVKSDDDLELEKIPNLVKLLSEGQKASASFGKRVDVAPELKQGIIDAGFEDVTEVIHKVGIFCCFIPEFLKYPDLLTSVFLDADWPVAKRSKTKGNWPLPTAANA